MKKFFLCLAILALLGSDLAFARGGGGHGGGGRGGHGGGGARMHGGARGGRGGGRHDGRGGHHGSYGRHHGGHRHYHGGHWYNYNSGWYLYAGLWYPWWYWPYRTETDVVIWQKAAPEDAKYADEAKLDELEEQSYRLKQQQEDLKVRMRALEEKQAKIK